MLRGRILLISILFLLVMPTQSQIFNITTWLNKTLKHYKVEYQTIQNTRNIVKAPCTDGYGQTITGNCRKRNETMVYCIIIFSSSIILTFLVNACTVFLGLLLYMLPLCIFENVIVSEGSLFTVAY